MPKTTRDLPITIGFRATEADVRKLNALAELTGRRPAEVMRLLLRRAVLKGQDLTVTEPLEVGEGEVDAMVSRAFLTTGEVARILAVSPDFVRQLVQTRAAKPAKPGGNGE